jgi:hypothetical protein
MNKEYTLLIGLIGKEIMKRYWTPLYKHVNANPDLIKTVPGFLLNHDKVVFYFGKTHLAIEYYGPERITETIAEKVVKFSYFDYTQSNENFLESIIGFKYDSTAGIPFSLPYFSDDLILPTNKGIDKMLELGWNFSAQSSITGFNIGNFTVVEKSFTRIINALFFDADDNGLKTRHIKWIDFLPLTIDDSGSEYDKIAVNLRAYSPQLAEHDAHLKYPLPDDQDYKYSKLPQINRFIELAGNKNSSETTLTRFLAKKENQFILSMAFLAKEIHAELKCEWQSENKDIIKPDFFVVTPNGYANIVEFKLPYTKSKTVVGKHNRESLSAEINSYIAQTRTYKQYFNDPNNRKWFEEKYGFKVHHPRRILVIGRRFDFKHEEWREIISEFNNLEIMTYDDLTDGVSAQFYK